MTGTQTMIYTAAVALSTLGIAATIAGWLVPQPVFSCAALAVVDSSAFAAWLVFVPWVASSRRVAKMANQRRRASAMEYTKFSRTLS